MLIEAIYPPYLYSIKYDEDEFNILDKLLLYEWQDAASIAEYLASEPQFTSNTWFKGKTPEGAAKQILNEADFLDERFAELVDNAEQDKTPDLDSQFVAFGGKYGYELELAPTESYGKGRPSLVRIYAIRIDRNKYLVTDGGIKLGDTVQNSSGLKDHVIQNFDRVLDWLKAQGIFNGDDLDSIMNE